MERGQFYHYETYGREASKAEKKKGSSVYSVLGEAFREPKYSSHVRRIDTAEHPPEIVFTDMGYDEDLDEKTKLEVLKKYLLKLSEGYAKAKKLKMKDSCILAGVVSYPPGTTLKMLADFRVQFVLPFLKKKWGASLRCVIGHSDEFYWDDEKKIREPHFQDHFYVIPDAQGKVRITELHAGKVAKNKAINGEIVLDTDKWQWIDKEGKYIMRSTPINEKNEEEKDKTKNKKHSDKAYKDAMRQEQDEFFKEVGEPCDWKRTTVKGVRYKREEVKPWKQNQREMAAKKETQEIKLQEIKEKEAALQAEKVKFEMEKKKETERLIGEKAEIGNMESEAVKEKERLINEGKKEAEKILADAKLFIDEAQDIKNAAFERGNIIIDSANKYKEEAEKNLGEEQKKILEVLNTDLDKCSIPKPTKIERTKAYFNRISNWFKAIIQKISMREKELKDKEKELKQKELELDDKNKELDYQLDVLKGEKGEEKQLKLALWKLKQKEEAGKGIDKTSKDKGRK